MHFSWQVGLLLGVVTQISLVAQATVITEPYLEPIEVVIETPASGERTVVRDSYIETYVPTYAEQQPVEAPASPEYSEVPYNEPTSVGNNNDIAIDTSLVTASVGSVNEAKIPKLSLPTIGGQEMQFPLALPAWISSSFGYRVHPISGESKFHQGTDIAAPEGTPVVAAWPGKVEIASWLGGLGFAVVISHDNGSRETRYGHLSEVLVEPGQVVKKGQMIGLVGSTGYSTGPHLHFELWEKKGEEWVVADPTSALIVAMDRLDRHLAQGRK